MTIIKGRYFIHFALETKIAPRKKAASAKQFPQKISFLRKSWYFGD
jgi:hypothetical protein